MILPSVCTGVAFVRAWHGQPAPKPEGAQPADGNTIDDVRETIGNVGKTIGDVGKTIGNIGKTIDQIQSNPPQYVRSTKQVISYLGTELLERGQQRRGHV